MDGGVITRGGVYFSSMKPQGYLDTLKFSAGDWSIFAEALRNKSRKSTVKAQEILRDIGYLEDKFVTGDLNRYIQGAIKRYRINYKDVPPTLDEIWTKIKDKFWFSDSDKK